MKHLRKILCCLIVLCLVLSVMPVQASAAGYANPCTLCGSTSCTISSSHPVHRIYGNTRYQTSFAIADALKKEMGVSKFPNVIIASGTSFADALSGSYLAIVKNAPILLTNGSNISDLRSYILNNLKSGGTIYILGGSKAVPSSVENSFVGFNCKRIWGQDRYETNLAILREAGAYGTNKNLLVCTGINFADSLSVSALGLPMLLVKGEPNSQQKEFLASTSGTKYIIGGTSVVSSNVEQSLKAYGSVRRIAGKDRYETSLLVAQQFLPSASGAITAFAQNFPDGLCGGPLAYRIGAPLILTTSGKYTSVASYTTSRGIWRGYVLGGTGLISDSAAKAIFAGSNRDTETRPDYNLGSNKNLKGSPYVILIFLDDNESYWDEASYNNKWGNMIEPGLNYLEARAADWGVPLDFDVGVYRTDGNINVRYNGIVANIDETTHSADILEQAAKSVGFTSASDMRTYLQEYSGKQEIVFMLYLNKDGRSYSVNDERDDGYDLIEYCVVFSHGTNYSYETTAATVAHELLHNYGAMDYYDPYGDYPNRKQLAEQYFYTDIMLRTYYDISYNTIGSYTAYSVGWSDTFPAVCDCPEWWS